MRTSRTKYLWPVRISIGALTLCYSTQPAWSQTGCTAGDVVRADARAMSTGQPAEMLAIFDVDARVYSLPLEKRQLTGPLSARLGTHDQRVATFESFTGPPQSVEVDQLTELGDTAVARLRITEKGKPPTFLLVAFQVRNCKIVDLWHIARGTEQAGRRQ